MIQSETSRGVILMILSMATFALGDAAVKLAAAYMSPAEIIFHMSWGGLAIFLAVAALRKERLSIRLFFHRGVLMRNIAEVVGVFGILTAIALIPLSTVTSIQQANPLLVTLGAALFLGEQVGWRRWSSIAVGFMGVMLIIRPGFEGFAPAALYAVLGTVGLSFRDIATRLVPKEASSVQLSVFAYFALTIFGLFLCVIEDAPLTPPRAAWPTLMALVCLSALAYFLITLATRLGQLSVIMPFRYTRLLFILIIGVFFFGERPDALTLIGAAIVICSGLFLLQRQAKTA